MGSVGDFIFGGTTAKQKSTSSSENSSAQSSQNSSGQASASSSSNYQKGGSAGYNQAYAPITAALSPALGYTTQAGDMIGALLGLSPNTYSYKPTTYTPGPILPSGGGNGKISLPDLAGLISSVAAATPKPVAPAPPPLPTGQVAGPPATSTTPIYGGGGNRGFPYHMQARELGGPVAAGQPYIVGEKRPEVFVPHQNGTILPDTSMMSSLLGKPDKGPRFSRGGQNPGIVPPTPAPVAAPTPVPPTTVSTQVNPAVNPGSALDTYANSAGLNFVLDQGQKAISGASAGNGVFNSGATGQALVNYGQQLGNTYLDQYIKNLQAYGNLGLGAASALTGAGGVTQSQNLGGGQSSSVSAGTSQGTSSGQSYGTSTGTASGNSHAKNGLLPDLAGLGQAYAAGGGSFG